MKNTRRNRKRERQRHDTARMLYIVRMHRLRIRDLPEADAREQAERAQWDYYNCVYGKLRV